MNREILVINGGPFRTGPVGVVRPAGGYVYYRLDTSYSRPCHVFHEVYPDRISYRDAPPLATEQLQELVDWAKTQGVTTRSI